MNKKELKCQLQQEAEHYVPNTLDVARRAFLVATQGVEPKKETVIAKARPFRWVYAAAPIMAVLILAIALTIIFLPATGGGGGGTPVTFTESVVRIDINPSVKFYVGQDGAVTKQAPCNKDGAVLLMKKDFVGLLIDNATEQVIVLAEKYGYLTKTSRVVALKVLNDNPSTENALKERLNATAMTKVSEIAPQAEVVLSGKNEVVDFLVASKKYTRREAEQLSAEQMEDVIETLMEDGSGEDLGELIQQMNDGMVNFLTARQADSTGVLQVLRKYEAQTTPFDMQVDDWRKIDAFVKRYALACPIQNFNHIDPDDFKDFLEQIEDDQEELEEALEELEEDPEELSDVLEDWYDQYKLYIKNYKGDK